MRDQAKVRGSRTDKLTVVLLAATFLVVAVLLGQALMTMRSHRMLVEATLEDFATFAAERVASELNGAFASIFLDQIAVSRTANYAWAAGAPDSIRLPIGRWPIPDSAVAFHFSIDQGRLFTHGGSADAELEAWILDEVGRHAREVYPRPAPYAVLRSTGPEGSRSVVYRKEQAYERESVYGFVVRFEEFGYLYREVVEDTPLLPRSLAVDVEQADLLSVDLFFLQGGPALFEGRGQGGREVVLGEAMAAKAGRMSVRVELDAEVARAMVAGGYPGGQIPLFVALSALTMGLLALSLGLLRRASRLSRLREDFVANVSHDLRTPLAQIRMFSETLLLGRLTEAGERHRSLEIIRRQAANLADLVDNILHASGRNSAPLRPTPTDLPELVGHVLEAAAPSTQEKKARFETDLMGAPVAGIDPAALRRILTNLVDNALKYGPVGQTIRVGLEHRDEAVRVTVDDQGPGVPMRDRTRVWERFTRLDHRGRAITGAGIGLAVVRDLAERHGGAVRLGERPGGGARVVVTLATVPA